MRLSVTTRRRLLACALLGIALLLGKNIGDVEFSNYRWLPPDNPIDRDKRYLDDEFNHGENLIALVRLPDSLENGFFSAGVYEELDAVVAQLQAIDKVSEVTSPLHAKTILKDAAGTLHNVSFQSGAGARPAKPSRLPETTARKPLLAQADLR